MNDMQREVWKFHDKFGATIGHAPGLRDTRLAALLIMEEAVETCAAMGYDVKASIDFGGELGNPASQTSKEDPAQTVVEFHKTFETPDFIESIDGICDLIFVALGAAVRFGIDIEPFFNEVSRANLAKEGGTTRADGKVLKPTGWQPPDHETILINAERNWQRFVEYLEREEAHNEDLMRWLEAERQEAQLYGANA